MITPGFSLISTERVLPRLALDFTTASLDARVTVARALNTATRVNSSGNIQLINADLPRFDYDPVSVGVCKGLLIEETRTNSFQYSQDLDNGYWSKYQLGVSKDAAISPDGTQNAEKLTPNTVLDGHALIRTGSTAGTTYAVSFFGAPAGYSYVFFEEGSGGNQRRTWVNLSTGTVGTKNAAHTVQIQRYSNSYYRVTITYTAATTGNFVFCPAPSDNTNLYSGDGTSGVYFYGLQNEIAATFSTSYIPTTTTSLTRNADAVSMTGTNFSDWFNVGDGTLMTQASQPVIFAASRSASSLNSGAANRITLYRQSAGPINGYMAPPGVAATASQNATANTSWKSALAFGATTASYAANSVLAATGYSHTVNFAALNELNIGNASGVSAEWFCGHVQAVRYYPQRLTDAEIRAITK